MPHTLQCAPAFLVERNDMFLFFHPPRASSYLKEKQSERKPSTLDKNLLKSLYQAGKEQGGVGHSFTTPPQALQGRVGSTFFHLNRQRLAQPGA